MTPALSVVIPAHNEEDSLPGTLRAVHGALQEAGIVHELVVVDDHSKDNTWGVLEGLMKEVSALKPIRNTGAGGFGNAIHFGLRHFSGHRVAIMMADLSDPPEDLVRFHREMDRTGVDCVFGSRAMAGAVVTGYPRRKWRINRLANLFLCMVFQYRYNDTTNPFKLYDRGVIQKLLPLRSTGFELEVELPVRAIIHGARYSVLPNGWQGRVHGESKMRLSHLFVPYLRMVWTCTLERFSRR